MRFVTVSVFIVVLATSAAACKDKPPTAPSTSVIALSGNLTFGSVTVGQTSTAQLTISNTGNAELSVTGVTYPTAFSGTFTSGTIAAGGSQIVTVTFAPTAAQTYTGNITVTGNQSSGTNSIAVSGTGTAIATFTLSGIVTETAPTTSIVLAGARVEFVDGANQGRFATTGSDGRYQITGVVNGGFTVRASLAGYTTAMLPVGINGNTTLDIRLDPTAPRMQFGPGQYRVGVDIPAGRYYNDPAGGCHFQRLRGFGGTGSDVIVETAVDFDAGQWIVDLLPTDAGFQTVANCNVWFTTPRRGLLTSITAGMWIVGAQITPGTYRTETAAQGCFWQRVSSFTGAGDAVLANGLATSAGPQLVTIASTDAGFSTNVECGTWSRTTP
jgi:hypothetical protein